MYAAEDDVAAVHAPVYYSEVKRDCSMVGAGLGLFALLLIAAVHIRQATLSAGSPGCNESVINHYSRPPSKARQEHELIKYTGITPGSLGYPPDIQLRSAISGN